MEGDRHFFWAVFADESRSALMLCCVSRSTLSFCVVFADGSRSFGADVMLCLLIKAYRYLLMAADRHCLVLWCSLMAADRHGCYAVFSVTTRYTSVQCSVLLCLRIRSSNGNDSIRYRVMPFSRVSVQSKLSKNHADAAVSAAR